MLDFWIRETLVRRYVLKRLFQAPALILLVAIINFTLIHIAPGDPAVYLAGSLGQARPIEFLETLRESMGLNRPLHEQLWIYLTRVFQGDFGYSYTHQRPVSVLILGRLASTVILMTLSLLISVVLGILLGVAASKKPYSKVDNMITSTSLIVYSMPSFWVGIVFILIFSYQLGFFPVGGMRSIDPANPTLDILWHLVLPATVLGLGRLALYMRLTRANMLEVLRQDYVTTAWAKGCDERKVYYGHALRNALLPVVTVIGFQFRFLLTGSVLVETVFSWPGIGHLLFLSVLERDYNLIMTIFFFGSAMVVIGNLLADLTYTLLDPRIRYR